MAGEQLSCQLYYVTKPAFCVLLFDVINLCLFPVSFFC